MPLYESLNVLTEKHKSLIDNIKTPLTDFYKKLNESANISGDYATSNLIQNALNQELQSPDADIAEILAAENTIQQFIENPQLELPKQDDERKPVKRRRKARTDKQTEQ